MKLYWLLTGRVPCEVRDVFSVRRKARRSPQGWVSLVSGPDCSRARDVIVSYAPDGAIAASLSSSLGSRDVASMPTSLGAVVSNA